MAVLLKTMKRGKQFARNLQISGNYSSLQKAPNELL
jgi:hypothetical protein